LPAGEAVMILMKVIDIAPDMRYHKESGAGA
jgi:hypothetical protein